MSFTSALKINLFAWPLGVSWRSTQSEFNSSSGHSAMFLEKTLYGAFFCLASTSFVAIMEEKLLYLKTK